MLGHNCFGRKRKRPKKKMYQETRKKYKAAAEVASRSNSSENLLFE